jgi:hypothetical protein
MFDQVQTALTVAIDVIAFIGLFGLPAHAIAMHHINNRPLAKVVAAILWGLDKGDR